MARSVDRRTTDQVFAAGNGEVEFRFDGFEDADGLGHDFRSDAVSGEDSDAVLA